MSSGKVGAVSRNITQSYHANWQMVLMLAVEPSMIISGTVGFNSRRKFEAVVPEHLWSTRLHHKPSKTPFDLTNVALSSLLPRGVWLGLSQLAVSLVQLLSKVPGEVLFGVVNYHCQWNSITTKKQEESLMPITL